MNNFKKYLIPSLTLLAVGLFVFIFTKIVIYFAISVLLALVGVPVTDLIQKLKIGSKPVPRSVAALSTLLGIYALLFLMIYIFFPPLIRELKFISNYNFNEIITKLSDNFPYLKSYYGTELTEEQIKTYISSHTKSIINPSNIKLILDNAASVIATLLGGTLAVSFITFFILKDKSIILSSILLITPEDYEDEIRKVIQTSRTMMTKYFTGLLLDVLLVALLVGITMYFMGIKNAFLIGFFAGIMNIIPYIGPLISMAFAIFLGITGCIEFNQVDEIQVVCSKIFFVLLGVNLIDGIVFQPYIFSSSVKAHPLEIFIVILMAATLAGVWGMVIAIPTYTLLRIIAKVFLSRSKFFRKLTERIA